MNTMNTLSDSVLLLVKYGLSKYRPCTVGNMALLPSLPESESTREKHISHTHLQVSLCKFLSEPYSKHLLYPTSEFNLTARARH